MEDNELINLWKSQDTQINQNVSLNQQTLIETLRQKGKSSLWGLKVIRWVGIVVGILWCVGVAAVLFLAWNYSNVFFRSALIINLICTAFAVGFYVYHLSLLRVFDNSLPIATAQQKLIALRNSNLKTIGILWVQLPAFSMWYMTDTWMHDSPYTFWFIQFPILQIQTFLGIWIYLNFDYKNHHKKWFQWFVSRGEFKKIDKAMSVLKEIEEVEGKNLPQNGQTKPKKSKKSLEELMLLDGGFTAVIAKQILELAKPLIQKHIIDPQKSIPNAQYQHQIHHNLRIVLDNVPHKDSLISTFKTADAFGIPKIYCCGMQPELENDKIALEGSQTTTWEYIENIKDIIQELKNQDFIIIAILQTGQEVNFPNGQIDPQKNYAFVFGSESSGLNNDIIALCDQVFTVPQFAPHADISVALSVTMWEVVKKMD